MARATALLATLALLVQGALALGVCAPSAQPKPHCHEAQGQHCCCAQKAKECACTIGAPSHASQPQTQAQHPAPTFAVLTGWLVIVAPQRAIERADPRPNEEPKPKEHRKPPDLGRAPPVA